jgi:hypothetical protein
VISAFETRSQNREHLTDKADPFWCEEPPHSSEDLVSMCDQASLW